ncbi:hypothetical protein [Xanthobacter sp. VNH20]|uniref:hypothetical protein n=1 Tax=Xanthobacter sp. VNH20 TaxID=3156616 RepID=UPI0032B4A92E
MKDALVVLGMHRSGTSCLAGALVHLGATPPRTLMEPTAHNLLGYFESTRISDLNQEILKSGGSDWSDWRAFNPRWRETAVAHAFSESARGLIEEEFGGAPLITLKDPRMCRLAPFWFDELRASGYAPRALLPVRNPLEVAQSLRERDGLSIAHGLLTWLRHVLDAEHATRSTPRDVISWNALLSDWRGTLETTGTRLNLAWPRWSDFSAAEIDGFISDTLRHQRVDDPNWRTRSEIHEWVRLAYDALDELSRTPSSNSALETLDQVRRDFDRACQLYGPALAVLQERLRMADARVGELDAHVEHVGIASEASRVEMEALRNRIRELEGEVLALTQDRDAIRAHVDNLEITLKAADETPAAFEGERAALAAEIERLNIALQAAEANLAAERAQESTAQDAEDSRLFLEREARLALESRALQAETELEALRTEYSNAQSQLDAEAARSAVLMEEISALAKDRDAIHAHSLTLQGTLEELGMEVAVVRQEMNLAYADRDAARAHALDVERLFEEARQQNENAIRMQAAAHEAELGELRAVLSSQSVKELESEEQARILREEIQKLGDGVEALRTDRDAVQAHSLRVQAELSELRAAHAAAALREEAGSAEERRLAGEVSVLHEEVAALTADRDAVHAHSLRMERGLSTARAEFIELERQTAAVQAELDRVLELRAASRRRARKLLGSKLAKWLVPDVVPPQSDA